VRVVLAAIDDPTLGVHDMLGTAHAGLSLTTTASAPRSDDALAAVETYLDGLGWEIPPVQEPAKRALAAALTALRVLGMEVGPTVFDPPRSSCSAWPSASSATVPDDVPREQIVESVVIGTVVFEAALVGLRRLAQPHHSGRRFAAAG
jgi:hypothetical protein